ncbi:hypothetical protein VNI00_012774 [Paramarasmius palmivorus]|uniref:Major facilitator superfamily (MFS) profile domain-containing protein n=1 Tax=Paramarasmius palmivorus TaxID=297713 RepID=A0AAW0C3D2_9AGAR
MKIALQPASSSGFGRSHQWHNNTHPKWWKDSGLRRNVGWVVALYLSVFALGYDGSLMSGLQALPQWNEYFNNPSGARLGLIVASLTIPVIIVAPLTSWCLDKFGRKITVSLGSFILIVGPLIGSFAQNDAMLIIGRVLVGGASFFTSIACACHVNELLHPRIRGVFSALFTTTLQVGSIIGSWVTFGTLRWQSNWSWRLPLLLQAIGPAILFPLSFFCPESPRWLVKKGEKQKAHKILARYHANGDLDDDLVKNELHQIVAAIEREEKERSSWKALLSTPGNRRRTLLVAVINTGPVMTGLTIVWGYLVPTLRLVGINNPTELVGISGGFAIAQAIGCMIGALCVDFLGRRPIFLISTTAMLILFSVLTVLMAVFSHNPLPAIGIAYVVILYLFGFFLNFGWVALAALYPPEILPFSLRAKGMALGTFLQSICSSFNTFVNPIALEAIGWKYYTVYIAVIAIYLGLLWVFLVETKGRTIEEIVELFDGSQTQLVSEEDSQGEVFEAKKSTHEVIEVND